MIKKAQFFEENIKLKESYSYLKTLEMDEHAKTGLLPLIPIHSLRHSNTTWLLSNKNLSLAEISDFVRIL